MIWGWRSLCLHLFDWCITQQCSITNPVTKWGGLRVFTGIHEHVCHSERGFLYLQGLSEFLYPLSEVMDACCTCCAYQPLLLFLGLFAFCLSLSWPLSVSFKCQMSARWVYWYSHVHSHKFTTWIITHISQPQALCPSVMCVYISLSLLELFFAKFIITWWFH